MNTEQKINFSVLSFYKKATKNGQYTSKLDTFGTELFHTNFTRSLIKFGQNWKTAFIIIILSLIFTHCFLIRQFAVIRFGNLIHEFDPYFNLRTTQYLEKHGLKAFWNWFDSEAWYPLGRNVGHTLYPGMMITTYFIHTFLNFFGLHISVNNVCVFIGPLFSGFTSIAAYMIGREMTGSPKTGLLTAFFVGISPSYLSRSVAGSYDNEAVAIFALVLSFYTWMKAINEGTLLHTLFAAFSTFYMITAWGGYVFVVNTIAVFVVILIFLNRFGVKEHLVYTSYYLIITILLLSIPFVGLPALKSSEHMGPHGVFILSHAYIFVKFVQAKIPIVAFRKLFKIVSYSSVITFIVLFVFLSYTGKTSWSGRSRTLLDPTYATNHHPLIASISEHQSPAWSSYSFDIGLIILCCPIGIYLCLKSERNSTFFVAIYALLSFYFSGIMVRLMLVVAPAAGFMAGLGVSYFIENFFNFLRAPSFDTYIKLKYEMRKKLEDTIGIRLSPFLALFFITLAASFCMIHAFYCTWVAAEAYSHPTIVSTATSQGNPVLQDDYREAYTWLRYNTHPKARIFSWWDYGYQTSSMANRTVIVDNNTWNHTHIATVGLAFSSNEENGYQIMKKLDVDYVLVVYGGIAGNSGDDLNKFLWMVRIAGGDFMSINKSDYLTENGQFTLGHDAPKILTDSLMYKMSLNQIHNINGGRDQLRGEVVKSVENLEYFEEVFTSENFLIRIYKLKPEPNFKGVYTRDISDEIQTRLLVDI